MKKITLSEINKASRGTRNPSHTFWLKQEPFAIQPFLIAPVLAGETLRNFSFQSNAKAFTLDSFVMGGHLEHYFFYCPFSCLPHCDEYRAMVLDPDYDASALFVDGDKAATFTADDTIDYVGDCLQAVTDEFFRIKDEVYLEATSASGLPLAAITGNTVLDSLMLAADYQALDFDADLNFDDTYTVAEIEKSKLLYELAKLNGVTEMTYEEYLATYGIKSKVDVTLKPELLRFCREWSSPVTSVDPSDGSPVSGFSYKIMERADKDRFFKEHGFIFGVSVWRPKVYYAQRGNAAAIMSNALQWLPAVLKDDATVGMTTCSGGKGPFPAITSDYMIDVRDLLVYGDQFMNVAGSLDSNRMLTTPKTDLSNNHRYCSPADSNYFTVGDTPPYIYQDGIVSFNIASSVKDLT